MGAKAIPLYTVPYELAARTMIISGSVSSALFPRYAAGSDAGAAASARRASCALAMLLAPLVIIGIGLCEEFLSIWISPGFSLSAKGIAEILLLGVWINAIAVPYHSLYMARNSPRAIAMWLLAQLPVYLILLLIMIFNFGVIGAAITWTFRVLIDTIFILYINGVRIKNLPVKLQFSLIVGAIMILFAMDDGLLRMLWCIPILLISFLKGWSVLKNEKIDVLRRK